MTYSFKAEIYALATYEGGSDSPIQSGSLYMMRIDTTEACCKVVTMEGNQIACGRSGYVSVTFPQPQWILEAAKEGDMFELLREERPVARGQVTHLSFDWEREEPAELLDEEPPRVVSLLSILATNLAVLFFAKESSMLFKIVASVVCFFVMSAAWTAFDEMRRDNRPD
ncbi:MAG: hypothetical protein AAF989_12745 [Planctomycetota bacterium]